MVKIKRSDDETIKTCFDPINDKGLKDRGVKVCSEISKVDDIVSSYITLDRGDYVSKIDVAIMDLPTYTKREVGVKPTDHYYNVLKLFVEIMVENGIIESLNSSMARNFINRGKSSTSELFEIPDVYVGSIIKGLGHVAPEELKELSRYALNFIASNTTDENDYKTLTRIFTPSIYYAFDKEDWLELDKINGGLLVSEFGNSLKASRILEQKLVDFDFLKKFKLDDDVLCSLAVKIGIPPNEIRKCYTFIKGIDQHDEIALGLSKTSFLPKDIVLSLFFDGDFAITQNLFEIYDVQDIILTHYLKAENWWNQISKLNNLDLIGAFLDITDAEMVFLRNGFIPTEFSEIRDAINSIVKEIEKRDLMEYSPEDEEWHLLLDLADQDDAEYTLNLYLKNK